MVRDYPQTVTVMDGRIIGSTYLNRAEIAMANYQLSGDANYLDRALAAQGNVPLVDLDQLAYSLDNPEEISRYLGLSAMGILSASSLLQPTPTPCPPSTIRRIDPGVKVPDKFSRNPKSLMDQRVLDAAKQGKGRKIMDNLNDPQFKGMEKWSYTAESANGLRSEVHYVRNPKTGELMDFKFKHHAETYK